MSDRKKLFIMLIPIALILIASVLWIILSHNGSPKSGYRVACIYQNGALTEEIRMDSLDQAIEKTIICDQGFNRVRIDKTSVSVFESDCPGKDCTAMGTVESEYRPISCLPHRLVVVIELRDSDPGLDGVAG